MTNEMWCEIKLEYLTSLTGSELAYWLIHSFTPARFYAGDKDVIVRAFSLLSDKTSNHIFTSEFIERLWGMHGELPHDIGVNVPTH